MPKINVYLPDELAAAVRDAQVPVSAVCQAALERAVRDVSTVRGTDLPNDESGRGYLRRFTPRARAAVATARSEAGARGHARVGTEHVLLGILDEGANLAITVLAALEVEPGDLRDELIGSLAPSTTPTEATPRFEGLAKDSLEAAVKEALAFGHNYIGCEHLLLGLLATEDGLASQVMRRMGLELRTTRRAVVTALSGFVHAQQSAQPSSPTETTLESLADIARRLDAIEQRLPA